MVDMLPLPVYAAILAVACPALAAVCVLAYRQLHTAATEEDRTRYRTRIRRGLGLIGLLIALYPIMYGKGLLDKRTGLLEYYDMVIGLVGLAIIISAVTRFSDPAVAHPAIPTQVDDANDGELHPDTLDESDL